MTSYGLWTTGYGPRTNGLKTTGRIKAECPAGWTRFPFCRDRGSTSGQNLQRKNTRVMCELIHIQELVCVVCSVGSLALVCVGPAAPPWKPFRVILHTLANARDKPGFIPPYSVLRAPVLRTKYGG